MDHAPSGTGPITNEVMDQYARDHPPAPPPLPIRQPATFKPTAAQVQGALNATPEEEHIARTPRLWEEGPARVRAQAALSASRCTLAFSV
jgi:hypothetical protein